MRVLLGLLASLLTAAPGWADTEDFKLVPAASGEGFGYSVAVSGDTFVLGAPWADVNAFDAGAVYVFGTVTGTPGPTLIAIEFCVEP